MENHHHSFNFRLIECFEEFDEENPTIYANMQARF
jgi:hypothetical protein